MKTEEYRKLAMEAHRAMIDNGYDFRVEVTTVTAPGLRKFFGKTGYYNTVLIGPKGMADFYAEALQRHGSRAITATWLKEHGVRARVLFHSKELFTLQNVFDWSKELEEIKVELDGRAALFAYGISLYNDPNFKNRDESEIYDYYVEMFLGEKLEASIEYLKKAVPLMW